LVTDAGVIADSTAIVRFADGRAPAERRLYPDGPEGEAAALEEEFDEQLGPHTRRLAYFHTLPHRAQATALAVRDVPRWEALVLRAGFPLARRLMSRGMRIDAASADRSLAKIARVFDAVDARLADGRRYLTGDRFSAADLTFAALASPILQPPEYPYAIADASRPEPLQALRRRFSATGAGAHALRVYRDHRR
jgi:glutathione S-transferase